MKRLVMPKKGKKIDSFLNYKELKLLFMFKKKLNVLKSKIF